MIERPRIIDVVRKPTKCPICGEPVVDIIYGTGDMTEAEFLMEYRREGIMGGDNIPRRPPIWACACGCKRFRKVNPDGTDAPVKVKMLKNVRRRPLAMIVFETERVIEALKMEHHDLIARYMVKIETECGEKETLSVYAIDELDAREEAEKVILRGGLGLKGVRCEVMKVEENTE